MAVPLFELYEDDDGWHWAGVRNGHLVARSGQAFSTKSNAQRALWRFLDAVRFSGYDVKTD